MTKRAMVFDDDQPLRELLTRILEQRSYEVVSFSEPRHCGVYTRGACACPRGTHCADLLITDLEMPHVDGLQLLQVQLRRGAS